MFIRILSILLSNAIAVYGVFFLNWNFFMVLYSYWFSELMNTVAEKITVKLLKKRGLAITADLGRQGDGRLFFLGIYWVFIVVIAGFITAPANSFFENIQVLLFSNASFNLNLLTVLVGVVYAQMNLLNTANKENILTIGKRFSVLNKRTLVMHVSIILGTFSWFAMNTDKFFFKIEAGEYGAYGFMMAFIFIRIVGDLWELKNSREK